MKKLNFKPVKTVIRKLKNIKADPVKICYGFAFGVFMSTTPLIGFKWMVALPIVWLARWNKMACLIGIMQVNYLTGPLFYALAYFVGKGVCGYSSTFELPKTMSFGAVKDIFFGNTDVFISLLTGGLILSVPLTIGAYYLVRSLFSNKLKTQLS
jgi:uncharacterized protein (DUF2062 family)